ncbi:MAG: prolipoprotein diacylglyceryl transferase [Candidatus Binatia bacterium]
MWPVIVQLGPLKLYSFGAMMAIAFLVAGWVTEKGLARRGLPRDAGSSLVLAAAAGGLIGSKLWYVLQHLEELAADPVGILFSGSGLVWYGGLIGGVIGVTWCIRHYALPWLATVDCIAPALALGQAIGRIGCQLAGDGDWGRVSDVPWAMAYPNAIIGWPYAPGVRVHPTPIYETLAYLAAFAVLWHLRKRPHPDGSLFWWYLVLAPGARFVIEFWRINAPVAFGLTGAQLFSLVLMAIGVWRLSLRGAAVPAPAAPARR